MLEASATELFYSPRFTYLASALYNEWLTVIPVFLLIQFFQYFSLYNHNRLMIK